MERLILNLYPLINVVIYFGVAFILVSCNEFYIEYRNQGLDYHEESAGVGSHTVRHQFECMRLCSLHTDCYSCSFVLSSPTNCILYSAASYSQAISPESDSILMQGKKEFVNS